MAFRLKDASALALNITQHLQFTPELCLRHLSPRSNCRICADICPDQAISIERSNTPGQIVDMDLDEALCSQCGLCSQLCPSSAFELKRPNLLELAKQAHSLSALSGGKVICTCKKTNIRNFGLEALELPCLASAPWEFWLYLASADLELSIFLPEGLCESCAWKAGEAPLIQEIYHAESILEQNFKLVATKEEFLALKEEFFSLQSDQNFADKRRLFFSELSSGGKQAAFHALESAMTTIFGDLNLKHDKPRSTRDRFEEEHGKQESSDEDSNVSKASSEASARDFYLALERGIYPQRKQLLLKSIQEKADLAQRTPISLPSFGQSCTHCKACAFLCPSEALIMNENRIELNALACSACGLCKEICWPQAIQFKDYSSLLLLHELQQQSFILMHQDQDED